QVLYQSNLSFFFFQAEDGIRDFHVTGVQTCALPILLGHLHGGGQRSADRLASLLGQLRQDRSDPLGVPGRQHTARDGDADRGARSEERRVGKEWRARWRADRW